VQVGVIDIVCSEYRNGVKIGEVRRDIQMNVVAGCIGSAPVFAPPVDPQGNPAPYYTAACGDTSVYIILDEPIQCGSVVPTDIRILTPQGTLNPVLTATPINCQNGVTDSILITFFYPLTAGTTYAFTKVGFDNNTFLSECGVQMPEFDSIPFNVVDPGIFDAEALNRGCSFDEVTVTFDYEIMCNTVTTSGSEFYLIDANGVNYPITAVTNCPGGNGWSSTITFNLSAAISPASPVYLMVQNGTDANTFTNRCNTFIQAGDTLAVLTVLNNLLIDLGPDATICDTDPLPVLDAGLSGATYTWTLNGNPLPDQTQTITASASGTYAVNVGVTPSCQGGDSIQITITPSPVVALGNDISLCSTDPFPTLDAGNPGATYVWSINGTVIAGATGQFYTPTVAGTYSVVVNTGATCTGTDDIIITVVQQLSVSVADVAICSDQPYPVLDAGVTGVTYEWTLNGNIVGTSQTYQPTAPGSYQVTISAGSCTANDIVTVNVVPVPVVTLSNSVICPGAPFPTLDAGNAGATYVWSTGETSQTITPSAAGTYTVTVTNGSLGLSCSASATATLTNSNPVTVSLGTDVAICAGDPTVTIDAGNPGSTYVWTLDGTTLNQTGQSLQVSDAGTYQVVVTDANGCTGVDDFILTVNDGPVINLGADFAICPGEDLPTLDATTSDAVSYSWTSSGTIVGSGPTLDVTVYGTYDVIVTDADGCTGADQVIIDQAPCEVDIPNVITPDNGDGKNDVFFIKNLDTNPNSQLMIFNRWGNEVFSSSNYQNNWDGDDLPDGTYFYTLVLQTGKDYKGTVKIIREK
jgi:gliding motility-associated-like protein